MYAIIKSGGKQYRVAEGDKIDVELLNIDQGNSVEFSEVLFVNDGKTVLIGEPFVSGYQVKGEVVGSSSGPKIASLKYRPRGHTQKHWGHRQHFTTVKITDIEETGKKASKKAEEGSSKESKASSSKSEKTTKPKAETSKAAPKRQKKKEEDK